MFLRRTDRSATSLSTENCSLSEVSRVTLVEAAAAAVAIYIHDEQAARKQE
jgi:hypothetical protein